MFGPCDGQAAAGPCGSAPRTGRAERAVEAAGADIVTNLGGGSHVAKPQAATILPLAALHQTQHYIVFLAAPINSWQWPSRSRLFCSLAFASPRSAKYSAFAPLLSRSI